MMKITISASSNKVERQTTKQTCYETWIVMWQWFSLFSDNYQKRIKRRRSPFSVEFNIVAEVNGIKRTDQIELDEYQKPNVRHYFEFSEIMASLCGPKIKPSGKILKLEHSLTSINDGIRFHRPHRTRRYRRLAHSTDNIVKLIDLIHRTEWTFTYCDINDIWRHYAIPEKEIHDDFWLVLEKKDSLSSIISALEGLYRLYIAYPDLLDYASKDKYTIMAILSSYFVYAAMSNTTAQATNLFNLMDKLSEHDAFELNIQRLVRSYARTLEMTLHTIRNRYNVIIDIETDTNNEA